MKYSIRDLLWLTLLAAFAVAWWIDRRQLAAELERLQVRREAYALDVAWPVSLVAPLIRPPVIVEPGEPLAAPPGNK